LKTQKLNQQPKGRCKRKTEPAKGSPRKDKKKKKSQAEGKNMGRKTVFWLGASVFFCLAEEPTPGARFSYFGEPKAHPLTADQRDEHAPPAPGTRRIGFAHGT
jgi:hypothetical protein